MRRFPPLSELPSERRFPAQVKPVASSRETRRQSPQVGKPAHGAVSPTHWFDFALNHRYKT
ncbi:MAG: hypothetical protein V7K95_29090 [Nostoc sp.]